jgi:imidazolonepropionase-like amidohydrolase
VRRLLALLALSALVAGDEVTAFVDVTVVPMDAERVLPHHTVLVRDGRIAAVGEDVAIPADARRIDGRGLHLMPGLADMHVHNWYEEEHVLFLAHGVTTVRNMWGGRQHLRWQAEIADGRRLGPTVYTTGPILDGRPAVWQESTVVTTAEEARRAVARLRGQGFSALKVYNRLGRDVYAALVDEAHRQGLRVAGHVPWAVGVRGALAARQDSIEHLDGYFGQPPRFHRAQVEELARLTAAASTWNCVTLVVYRKFLPFAAAQKLYARPEMKYVPPRLRATWDPRRDFRLKDLKLEHVKWIDRWNEIRLQTTRILHDAGARLLLGTDCGNPFVVAGWSAHEELGYLVQAGLTPYEALLTGTRHAAAYLGADFGTVAVGRRADLVLVAGNPLEDVAHVARRRGVMVRGRWLPAAELARRLEELLASYARPKERFKGLPPLPPGEAFRYEVFWNGLVVGEERFVVVREADGSRTVHVQQVNDPPYATRKQRRLRFDAAPEEGRLAASSLLASWIGAARRLAKLEVGEEKAFDFVDLDAGTSAPLRVRREPDRAGGRVYALVLERPDGIFKSRLVLDPDGLPLEKHDELQQGTVVFRRMR